MAIKTKLIEIFKSRGAGPFLFIGSGFSRRYLGLEDWRGLLSRFCVAGSPFEFYLASANGDYPTVARLLAEDFNKYWWNAEEYKSSVSRHKSKVTNITSALRIEVCNYLSSLDQTKAKHSEYAAEVELLSSLNVDGVITTNWDTFIEQIFPDYKTYIGQNELLFSNPQEIGEIYKIHGCSTVPNSLVLTNEDYDQFNDRNAYLAAKLITIFVEHPIVFLGYSLSDQNITQLLRAISLCIGKENIEQLRRNLIFVQRQSAGEEANMSDTYVTIDGVQIPLVLIKTTSWTPIYESLGATKRKIPARILRYCKEQLYELVQSAEPEKKLCVVDIDAIDHNEDVEFLVGVGVASSHENGVSDIGYAGIETKDLILDLLHENSGYGAQQVLDNVVRRAGRNTKNVPVFKYLREIGINNADDYNKSGLALDKWVNRDVKDFRVKMYAAPFFRKYRHQTIKEVIDGCTPENASAYIPFISKDKIDLEVLKDFLIKNQDKLDNEISSYASNFRKLAALYDKLRWGW
ncbi:MAG: SIR2 family protein [Gallionella sp.]|nr:SIR2 family protein [Gallionella sp.]